MLQLLGSRMNSSLTNSSIDSSDGFNLVTDGWSAAGVHRQWLFVTSHDRFVKKCPFAFGA